MVAVNERGEAVFRIFLPDASSVEIIGDFTDWSRAALAMQRIPPGWWEAAINLAIGAHQFCYLVDRQIQIADYAAHGVRLDRSGRWLSDVYVRSPVAAVGPPTTPAKKLVEPRTPAV